MLSRGAIGISLVLLATSLAFAGAASTVTSEAPAALEGASEVLARGGTVELASEAAGGVGSFTAAGARARVTYYDEVAYCAVFPACAPAPGEPSRTLTLTDAEVEVERFDAGFTAEWIEGGAFEGDENGALTTLVESDEGLTIDRVSGSDEALSVIAPAGAIASEGGFRLGLFQALVHVTGTSEDGRAVDERFAAERTSGAAPGSTMRVSWIVVDFPDGALDAVAATPVMVVSESLLAETADGLSLRGATGEVPAAAEPKTPASEDVEIPGAWRVVPTPASDGRLALSIEPLATVATDATPADASDLAAWGAAGAGVLGLAGAAVWFWPRLKYAAFVLALPLYTRIERGEALEHTKREEIYGLIREAPGIHAHEISERASIGWGTTVYHLNLLESHGLVVSKRQGRYKRFFLSTAPKDSREAQSVLRNTTTHAVAQHVHANPGATQKEICQALGIQPSLATWHVVRLEQAGLVKRVREGRLVRHFAGPAWATLTGNATPTSGPAASET